MTPRLPDKRPLDFRLIRRVLQYTSPYAAKRNVLLVLVVTRAIQLPALSWLIGWLIDGPIQHGNVRGLIWGAAGFGTLAVATQVVFHFRQRLALELGESVIRDLRNHFFEYLQQMPMSFFHRTPVGHVISNMVSDIESIRQGVQEVLFVSLVALVQMFAAAVLMCWYDAGLFLIVLALVPVLWRLNRSFHGNVSHWTRVMRESFGRVTATLAESILGVRVTQSFVRQEENARRFSRMVSDHSLNNLRVARAHALFLPLLDLNNQVFTAVLLLVGSWQVLSAGHATSVGDLVGFLLMANMFFGPISTIGNQYNQAMTTMAGAERVFEFLDTPPEWSDPPEPAVDTPRLRGRVEFQNLSFGYEPGRPVLEGVNFTARPGQTIALVGHTGSGKTSLIHLIAKFYLPTSGHLRIDGVDVRQLSGPWLRRQIGIVLQQNFLFTGTIADNIRMGRPEASDADLSAALDRLGCRDLFDALPDGLKTPVTQRGENLSLGQRQLVCFARAMLADPRILILDEATSSIDSFTEARIQQALGVLMAGRTSFVVAHRLSTIRDADAVLVLDGGRIVERGRHDELVVAGGRYEELYRHFARAA
jgi:ATP-binding cassette subfamily B protein